MNVINFHNLLLIICGCLLLSCKSNPTTMYKIETLTQSDRGHTLHHNSVFNFNNEWIVFDARNDDTKIGECTEIGMVNVKTKEERIIYQTKNPSQFGPGVGAASFHPHENRVIFIHGLPNANAEKPYAMTRRFGMLVDIDQGNLAIPADSRDITKPYSKGSLRGGTHSHAWSPEGNKISFTYNDEFVEPDLRTVGLMVETDGLDKVDEIPDNVQGTYCSTLVANVVSNPVPGSDQIEKAFDECWLDNNLLAFQGNTRNKEGKLITEVYVVEVNKDILLKDSIVQNSSDYPPVPFGINPIRISRSEQGLSNFRHWLRASPDGKLIYALAKDKQDRNQIIQCDIRSGKLTYLTEFDLSVSSPINLDPKGERITFIADNNVYLFHLKQSKLEKLTGFATDDSRIQGIPNFSRDGKIIAFNQFVENNGKENLQIKLIYLE